MPTHPITETRKSFGLSQKQLADKAGVSRSLLSYMEHGFEPPRSGAAEAVAEALGVRVERLFTKESGSS
ncbi:MAG: helix-turn-helix transcriptional regulator [Solirubrobacteraceae bacterium]